MRPLWAWRRPRTGGGTGWPPQTEAFSGVFGDAGFYGAMRTLHAPIVGMAATPDGRGYWLAAADGGVFAFGDAGFYGAMRALHVRRLLAWRRPRTGGDWLAAADGGVFAFGRARFYGASSDHNDLTSPSFSDDYRYLLVYRDRTSLRFGPKVTAPVPKVVGNQLEDVVTGRPLRLLGVDASGTEDAFIKGEGFSWGPSMPPRPLLSLPGTPMRPGTYERGLLARHQRRSSQFSGAFYQNEMVQWVQAINDAGMVAILDLHWSAPASIIADEQWPMADQDHSVTFWSQVASSSDLTRPSFSTCSMSRSSGLTPRLQLTGRAGSTGARRRSTTSVTRRLACKNCSMRCERPVQPSR